MRIAAAEIIHGDLVHFGMGVHPRLEAQEVLPPIVIGIRRAAIAVPNAPAELVEVRKEYGAAKSVSQNSQIRSNIRTVSSMSDTATAFRHCGGGTQRCGGARKIKLRNPFFPDARRKNEDERNDGDEVADTEIERTVHGIAAIQDDERSIVNSAKFTLT